MIQLNEPGAPASAARPTPPSTRIRHRLSSKRPAPACRHRGVISADMKPALARLLRRTAGRPAARGPAANEPPSPTASPRVPDAPALLEAALARAWKPHWRRPPAPRPDRASRRPDRRRPPRGACRARCSQSHLRRWDVLQEILAARRLSGDKRRKSAGHIRGYENGIRALRAVHPQHVAASWAAVNTRLQRDLTMRSRVSRRFAMTEVASLLGVDGTYLTRLVVRGAGLPRRRAVGAAAHLHAVRRDAIRALIGSKPERAAQLPALAPARRSAQGRDLRRAEGRHGQIAGGGAFRAVPEPVLRAAGGGHRRRPAGHRLALLRRTRTCRCSSPTRRRWPSSWASTTPARAS